MAKTLGCILTMLILMLNPFEVFAQEPVMLQGRVVNDSIEHEYLHILNLSLQKGTITNEAGVFTIPVREHDTLYVSALQFKHETIPVTREMVAKKYLEIKLVPEITELDDVQISDSELSGRLGDDMNLPKLEKPFDPAAAGLPVYKGPVLTQEERKLYTATHSGGGIIPIGAVINAITGETKRLKEQVRISNMEIRVQKARNLVSDTTYIKSLNIPARYIDDFVHYVYFDNTQTLAVASSKNPLSLLEMLMEKAPLYLQYKESQGVNVRIKTQEAP